MTYLAGALLRKACILGYLLPISRGRAHPITDSGVCRAVRALFGESVTSGPGGTAGEESRSFIAGVSCRRRVFVHRTTTLQVVPT